MAPLLSSSLVCGTVLALLLNALFRLGVKRSASLSIEPSAYKSEQLQRFLDHVQAHDRVWVCRRVDIARHWQAEHPFDASTAFVWRK